MKRCPKCKQFKDLSEFYFYESRKVYQTPCKECSRAGQRARYYQQSGTTEEAVRTRRALMIEKRTPIQQSQLNWKRANPVKTYAQAVISDRIRRGVIIRPEQCSQCGSVGPVEAHHPDYAKPLEVIWVCKRCHYTIHGKVLHVL